MYTYENRGIIISDLEELLENAFQEVPADEYVAMCEEIIGFIRDKLREKGVK